MHLRFWPVIEYDSLKIHKLILTRKNFKRYSELMFFKIFRYIVDHDDPSMSKTSFSQWLVRILFLLLQIAPLLRYVDTLIFGLRSKVAMATGREHLQTTLYRRMLDEDTNSALLRLFHCFLHSAPQAVIQLMILLTHIANPESMKDVQIG